MNNNSENDRPSFFRGSFYLTASASLHRKTCLRSGGGTIQKCYLAFKLYGRTGRKCKYSHPPSEGIYSIYRFTVSPLAHPFKYLGHEYFYHAVSALPISD